MGCCFSKKRMKHPDGPVAFPRRYKPEDRDPPPPPSPEEEKVKEVLSETPSTKVTADPKPVANAVVVEEPEVLKVKASADAAVSDLGSCFSLATDERSEAASESSVATSSVMGPERSPSKPARRRPVSGELGLARRDRAAAAAYGVRSRSCRASPSPPPRRDPPRDRSVRRSPSPAAKRPSPEQHRAGSPAASLQRKPPVPSRRASPHRAREAPPPPLPPPPQPEEDAVTAGGADNVAEANASGDGKGHGDSDGEGKESLENPLVSMECFIFL